LNEFVNNRSDKPFGLDLVALNIQRGREHGIMLFEIKFEIKYILLNMEKYCSGIPDFNTIRSYCGLKKASMICEFGWIMKFVNTSDIGKILLKRIHDVFHVSPGC